MKRAREVDWLKKGFWVALDQSLFAGSNFTLNVLLARGTSASDYGAFTVVFSIFLFLGTFHTALFREPLLVFGPGHYAALGSRYVAALTYGHGVFSAATTFVLLLIALVFHLLGSENLAIASVGFALASPWILYLWLMRLAFYARYEPRQAALAGLGYAFLMTTGLLLLSNRGLLSLGSALLILGLSNLAAGVWLLFRSHPAFDEVDRGFFREVVRKHFRFGQWGVASAVFLTLSGQVFFWILPVYTNIEASAALRALNNLVMPMLLAGQAFSALLSPHFIRAREEGTLNRLALRALALTMAAAVAYWILLGILHREVFALVYAGNYAEYSSLLWIFGLLPITSAPVYVIGQAIRVRDRPDWVFGSCVASALFSVVFGTALIMYWGLNGAVIAMVAANAVSALVLVGLLLVRGEAPGAVHARARA